MTPRSLFLIIIKVLGILMLYQAFVNCKELIFHVMRFLSSTYEGYLNMVMYSLAVVADATVVYLFIFRPEAVIDRMKLDQGFYEEQFTFAMDRRLVMSIVVALSGLYLLMDSIPELTKYLVQYFSSESYNKPGYSGPVYELHSIAFCFVKIVLAYIFLTNHEYIARFITGRREEEDSM